ncbi:helix-turn-helix domain-containing protein [Bacillus thuringiensis]|uniref:helix-turn-helix domain-containing protein n=1 Tax=Bacillus thuringiensis TaxID=1428 RepID=UPI0011128909|nr:helix-turn-helix transcriptional regulator [Bacillus thuringiensis]QCY65036.1 helix-turn-helix domain-containing protein [Bacillus thuringiensis]
MSKGKRGADLAPMEEFLPIARKLRGEREARDWTLTEASKRTGISVTFLSEVERALKAPSALAIRDLARAYDIDESELAAAYGKTPLLVQKDLSERTDVLRMIYDIKNTNKLTEDEKDDFYKRVLELYHESVEGKE